MPVRFEPREIVAMRAAVSEATHARGSGELASLPGFRPADVLYAFMEQPASAGRDLVGVLRSPAIGEVRGLYDVHGTDAKPSIRPSTRLYFATYHEIVNRAEQSSVLMRTTTKWRMASAVLEEMATARVCETCQGSGLNTVGVCGACGGRGYMRHARTWRATECECKVRDFGERLDDFYNSILTSLYVDERKTLRGIADTMAATFGPARLEQAMQKGIQP